VADAPPTVAADQPTVTTTDNATTSNTGTFADYDDAVTITELSGPAGTISQSSGISGTWSWTQTSPLAAGSYTVIIEATNAEGSTATTSFTLIVNQTPRITSVVINQDISALYNAAGQPFAGAQRSMVNDIVYTFSEGVNITGSDAFTIAVAAGWTGTAPTPNWAPITADGTEWAVTFSGGSVTGGSIANGAYTITINSADVTAVSGGEELTVTPGAAPASGNPDYATQQFYRLFGDINGDKFVNAADNVYFKNALTTYNAAFDYSQDGFVNASDNVKFKADLLVNFSGFTPTI
jgi:Dockerin type I domain